MALVFVRHAESLGNVMSRDERAMSNVPNHLFPLTERGTQQAEIVGNYLGERFGTEFFGRVFESDFLRTHQTTDRIMEHIGNPQRRRDSRLNEKWDGIFHDLTHAEVEARYPEQLRMRKRTGYYLYRAPGGESCPDVEGRIRSFNRDTFSPACNFDHGVLIIGHGRWHLLFQKLLFGWSVEEFLDRKEAETQDNCMVTVYDSDTLHEYLFKGRTKEPDCVVPWHGHLESSTTEYA